MIFGAEIGLLLLGIYAFFTGKLVLTKARVVHGAAARLLGILACVPFTASFGAGFVIGFAGIDPASDGMKWKLIAFEAGLLIVCTALIYAIGWSLAESSDIGVYAEDGSYSNRSEVRSPRAASQSSMKGYLIIVGIGAVTFLGGLLISGNWSSFFPAASTETADSDVDEIPPKPAVAGPVPASLMLAPWQPRVDRMLKYNRRSLAGAYDAVGNKSPNWDEHAYRAMELTALYFSNTTDPGAQPKDIHASTQIALQADCDDPLILYLHVRSADPKTPEAELDRGYARAAKAMQSSAYPPMRRAAALWKAANRTVKHKDQPGAKSEAVRLINASVALLPVSAREEERCLDLEQQWYEIARDAFAAYQKLGYEPHQVLHGIDRVLATEKSLEATQLLLKGEFYIKWAWEARGSGYANTVTADRNKQFNDRLTIAREALEESWRQSPHYGKPATFMLTVEMGQSRGRAEMEKWFEQAIQLEPNNTVCGQKLEWLHPKWHGSTAEMLAFGHACRDSENWARGYPLLIVDTHQRIADMRSSDAAKSAYFRQPDVAADILYVYAKSLECYPDDAAMRSRYAYYSFVCGHPRRAHAQFERLGDKLWWGDRLTEKLMKETRAKAANPPSPTNPTDIVIINRK